MAEWPLEPHDSLSRDNCMLHPPRSCCSHIVASCLQIWLGFHVAQFASLPVQCAVHLAF